MKYEELAANKSRSLKVMFFGLAIGAVGFLLHWWLNIKVGSLIFVLGWLVGVCGLVANMKAMYLLSKEKPENLHPLTKQPWER